MGDVNHIRTLGDYSKPIREGYRNTIELLVGNNVSWLDACDEPIGDLDMMENKVDNPSPERIPMEVEPLDHTRLEDLGLNTYSHDLFLSFREVPSVDEPEPQLLPNFLPLSVNLGDKRGTDPPINPYSLGDFKMKVVGFLNMEMGFLLSNTKDKDKDDGGGEQSPVAGLVKQDLG
nr:hypothetical protein [Tanacetum cinerariifolium]